MLALSLALAVGPTYVSVSKPSVSVRHSPVVVRHHTLVPTTSALRPFVARLVMKDDNRTPDPKKDDPKKIDATSVISGLTTLAIAGAFALDVFGGGLARAPEPPVIAYSQLVKEIKAGEVAEVLFSPTDRELFVMTSAQTPQRVSIFPSAQPELVSLLEAKDVPFSVAQSPAVNPLIQFGELLLRLAFPAFLLFSIFGNRGGGGGGTVGGGGGGGPMGMIQNLGKAKSKVQLEPDTGVNFADVAGCDGSKLELREVVEFLKTPGKFAAVGARAPRGVLLEGPPGTGKTLLARAVAGEAGVPFISASGSEFVEMFVGVGASRIRDLFAQAKAASPCIIFIDEIDAIGKSRAGGGGGMGGGNDEREQTLNQILTEMDGFEKATGVVVIAATNRADVLDSALLRPGRFDRRVPVELPDRIGRRAILSVHARDKPLGSDVDLDAVAARTTGFSGASLANLLNEAAIVTARRDKKELGMPEVEYALDRLTVGLEKSTGMASEARKRLVAVHEAGHAILAALTPGFDAVGKVTIVPRSNGAGGFTLFVPSDERQDSGMYSRRYLESQLEVALGGRVAEEIIYGADDVTTGASSDLQRVADVARRMVTQWGFATDSLSATAWESPMGTNFNSQKMASEATQQRIDAAVETIVRSAYEKCKATLTRNRALLDELANLLVEQETIGNDELMVLVKKYAVQPGSAGAGELL